jgi:hypothetical protein
MCNLKGLLHPAEMYDLFGGGPWLVCFEIVDLPESRGTTELQ